MAFTKKESCIIFRHYVKKSSNVKTWTWKSYVDGSLYILWTYVLVCMFGKLVCNLLVETLTGRHMAHHGSVNRLVHIHMWYAKAHVCIRWSAPSLLSGPFLSNYLLQLSDTRLHNLVDQLTLLILKCLIPLRFFLTVSDVVILQTSAKRHRNTFRCFTQNVWQLVQVEPLKQGRRVVKASRDCS